MSDKKFALFVLTPFSLIGALLLVALVILPVWPL